MYTRLPAAEVVDFIRSYSQLSALTNISIVRPGGASFSSGKFKGLGANHIDVDSNGNMVRVALNDQFSHIYIEVPPSDKITLYFPNDTVV